MARRKGWISVSSSLGGAAIMQSSVGKNQGRVGRPVREMIIIVAIRITLVILMIMVIIVAIRMIKKAGRKFVKLGQSRQGLD